MSTIRHRVGLTVDAKAYLIREEARDEKDEVDEVEVIAGADAVVDPRAVVVEHLDA